MWRGSKYFGFHSQTLQIFTEHPLSTRQQALYDYWLGKDFKFKTYLEFRAVLSGPTTGFEKPSSGTHARIKKQNFASRDRENLGASKMSRNSG